MKSSKFQGWSNEQLRTSLEKWVSNERRSSVVVIEHVAEVMARRSFVDWGFANIYDYLIKGLSYSERAAHRRIQAAQAMIQVPEIKEEIESGALNLSQVTMVQSAIRQEQKMNGTVSVEQKRELFGELLNKTVVETQKILDQTFETSPIFSQEKHKHDDSVEITVRMPKELFEIFTRIKELNSHSVPNGHWAEILAIVGNDYLKRNDPLLKSKVSAEATQRSCTKVVISRAAKSLERTTKNTFLSEERDGCGATESNSQKSVKQSASDALAQDAKFSTARKSIRPRVKRFVFQRDRCCQYKNVDGSICGSRYQLEIDHIKPKFTGGSDEIENLRLLCRGHNQARYVLGR